jgi:hypothetical protein
MPENGGAEDVGAKSTANMTEVTPTTEPTETSIPPVSITKRRPIEIMPLAVIWLNTFIMFGPVKNVGEIKLAKIINNTSTIGVL